MEVELVSYTQGNPALDHIRVSDANQIENGKGTYAENLIEYAGRVCYLSTARMGTAPNFVNARVREGHEDIVEHPHATVLANSNVNMDISPSKWKLHNRHIEVTYKEMDWPYHRQHLVTANLRSWLDLFRDGVALEALPVIRHLAPKVFEEIDGEADSDSPVLESPMLVHPYSNGQIEVSLLGHTCPTGSGENYDYAHSHNAATFLIEGISRTCSHQLVRHRLGSYSQESQRYVGKDKGGWKAIVPPSLHDNDEAFEIMNDAYDHAELAYEKLRQLKVRKEDARFVLPSGMETRLVVTMPLQGWSHFIWLRAVDKAAQWEIREVGQALLTMLYKIWPDVFQKQWDKYQEMMQ